MNWYAQRQLYIDNFNHGCLEKMVGNVTRGPRATTLSEETVFSSAQASTKLWLYQNIEWKKNHWKSLSPFWEKDYPWIVKKI